MTVDSPAEPLAAARRQRLDTWLRRVLADPSLAAMGHAQRPASNDLGLGWIYYGLARLIRPHIAIVIGSHRGFVPIVIGRALSDSGAGRVIFIDPSLVDGFWQKPARVRAHFARFGLTNVEHHLLTTQAFVETAAYAGLRAVDLVFIDGYHSYEQARFDFEAFEPLVSPRGAILLHDSIRIRPSRVYGPDKVYEHRVRELVDEIRRDPRFQVFDVPFGDGLTMVRKPASPETLYP